MSPGTLYDVALVGYLLRSIIRGVFEEYCGRAPSDESVAAFFTGVLLTAIIWESSI